MNESNLLLLEPYLVTDDCILVWLRRYKPKNLQVYMSLIHIEIGIRVFIQNKYNGKFSGTHGYLVIKALIRRHHNNYSSLCISVQLIIGITNIYTLTLKKIHLNFFLIWNPHFNKDRNDYKTFKKLVKERKYESENHLLLYIFFTELQSFKTFL